MITLDSESSLMTPYGEFKMLGYRSAASAMPIVALVLGEVVSGQPPLVRIHCKCTTGEVFGSYHCDCKAQLDIAFRRISRERAGVLIYLDQEARGNGLRAKLKIYELMQKGLSSYQACELLGYPPDNRTYDGAAAVLATLGLTHIRLLTNNPEKIDCLKSHGIAVEREKCIVAPNDHNKSYLDEKRMLGHLM